MHAVLAAATRDARGGNRGEIGRRQARGRHGHHRHLGRGGHTAGRLGPGGDMDHANRMMDRAMHHLLGVLHIDGRAGLHLLGHMHGAAADQRTACDQDSQFCDAHTNRHSPHFPAVASGAGRFPGGASAKPLMAGFRIRHRERFTPDETTRGQGGANLNRIRGRGLSRFGIRTKGRQAGRATSHHGTQLRAGLNQSPGQAAGRAVP
jgi:hypothetical protein